MTTTPEVNDNEKTEESLDDLKAYAKELNVSFHPSIGREKLLEKIAIAEEEAKEQESSAPPEKKVNDEQKKRIQKRRDANRLVRVQITCMNPNKKAWEGEIFTVANSVVGTFRKYIPFNVPWHVPNIIYKQLLNRKCQVFHTPRKGPVTSKLINEFSVQELPPLTEQELKELAQRQAMARGET